MADVEGIRALVQDAIDRGATSVEEVHKMIAAMPLEALKKIEPLGGAAESAQELTTRSIGAIYDAIRGVNAQVGEVAKQMLGGAGGGSSPS